MELILAIKDMLHHAHSTDHMRFHCVVHHLLLLLQSCNTWMGMKAHDAHDEVVLGKHFLLEFPSNMALQQ